MNRQDVENKLEQILNELVAHRSRHWLKKIKNQRKLLVQIKEKLDQHPMLKGAVSLNLQKSNCPNTVIGISVGIDEQVVYNKLAWEDKIQWS